MREWFKDHSTEISRFCAGIVAFTLLAGLVVAYATPLQEGIFEYPGATAVIGGIIICAMTTAASINLSRYVFLIAIPLVLVSAVVWVLLTLKTLNHFEFYTTVISQTVSRIPEPLPAQLSNLSSQDRRQFERVPRQLERATLRLRHHLDRHAFWSRALLAIAICAVAVGLLPKLIKTRLRPTG